MNGVAIGFCMLGFRALLAVYEIWKEKQGDDEWKD